MKLNKKYINETEFIYWQTEDHVRVTDKRFNYTDEQLVNMLNKYEGIMSFLKKDMKSYVK